MIDVLTAQQAAIASHEHTLQRRAAAILEIRFRTLARAGLPIAAAYKNPPMPSIQLETRIAWT